jgi:hypothetical protein
MIFSEAIIGDTSFKFDHSLRNGENQYECEKLRKILKQDGDDGSFSQFKI